MDALWKCLSRADVTTDMETAGIYYYMFDLLYHTWFVFYIWKWTMFWALWGLTTSFFHLICYKASLDLEIRLQSRSAIDTEDIMILAWILKIFLKYLDEIVEVGKECQSPSSLMVYFNNSYLWWLNQQLGAHSCRFIASHHLLMVITYSQLC